MASFTPLSLQHVLLCSLRTIVLPLGQPCRGPSSSTQTPWMSSCRSLGCGKARQLSHLGSSRTGGGASDQARGICCARGPMDPWWRLQPLKSGKECLCSPDGCCQCRQRLGLQRQARR